MLSSVQLDITTLLDPFLLALPLSRADLEAWTTMMVPAIQRGYLSQRVSTNAPSVRVGRASSMH